MDIILNHFISVKRDAAVGLLLLILVGLYSCTPLNATKIGKREQQKQYSKEQFQELLHSKIRIGSGKDDVVNFLKESGAAKYTFNELIYDLGPPDPASLKRLGSQVPLAGSPERGKDIWRDTRYGIVAQVKSIRKHPEGWQVTIWIRVNFDENEKVIACFLNEEVDSP